METAVHRRSRVIPLAAILAVVIYGLFVAVPAESAIPAGSVVGRVTYTDISGTTDLVTTIRSFEMTQELLEGEFSSTFGAPVVVHDVLPQSPLIMSGLARGLHYSLFSVVLFYPGTTTRFQQWNFAEVQFRLDDQAAGRAGQRDAMADRVVDLSQGPPDDLRLERHDADLHVLL